MAAAMLNPVRGLLAPYVSPLSPSALVPKRDIPPDAFHCHAVPVVETAASTPSSPRLPLSPLRSPAAACRRFSANKTLASKKTPDPCFRSVQQKTRYTPTDYFGVRLVDRILTRRRYSWIQARFQGKHLGYFDTDIEAAPARDAHVRVLPAAYVSNFLGRNYRVPPQTEFPRWHPQKPIAGTCSDCF